MPVEFPPVEDDADLERVVTVLDDAACRKIISTLDEPMTASEIATKTELPLSTTYKKLDRLAEASLVRETVGIHQGRHRKSRYIADFSEIAIGLDDEQDLHLSIERSDSRHTEIWSEMSPDFRKESR
ncbi:helix-turn-helix domain-containing protein [Halostagnicola bangensis]